MEIAFKDLLEGETFKFFGDYYIKVVGKCHNKFKRYNCLRIWDGATLNISNNTFVKPVKGFFKEL